MIGVTTRTKLIYSEFINEKQKGILNQFLYEMYDSEYPRVASTPGYFSSPPSRFCFFLRHSKTRKDCHVVLYR